MRKTKTIGGNRGFVPYRPGCYTPFVPNSGLTPPLDGEEDDGKYDVTARTALVIPLYSEYLVLVSAIKSVC